MNHALDACAMIAYLRGEPGQIIVDGFLNNPADTCYAHTINLLEVYYDFIRKYNEPVARQALADLATAGVIERRDMNRGFVLRVGQPRPGGGSRFPIAFALCWLRRFPARL